ncbi:MAG: hypothetical protein WCA34_09345 [Candidatus Acidiferrales bacterium]
MCTAYHNKKTASSTENPISVTAMRELFPSLALTTVSAAPTTIPITPIYSDTWYINHSAELWYEFPEICAETNTASIAGKHNNIVTPNIPYPPLRRSFVIV